MPTTRGYMEAIELAHGKRRGAQIDGEAALLGLANRTPDGRREVGEKSVCTVAKVQRMSVKGQRRLGRQVVGHPPANFEPLPATYLGKCAKVLKDDAWIAVAEEKRRAKIGKGKADASGSCKATCNFNER